MRILVSKFQLDFPLQRAVVETPFQIVARNPLRLASQLLVLLRAARTADAIFLSNPRFPEQLFGWLARRLCRNKPRLIVFDLILRVPRTTRQKLLARVQRVLLRAVDRIVFIHRDTGAYERHYGVTPAQCVYVPFKANNFDLRDSFAASDGDYVVALGASHRDYRLLIEALTGSGIPLKIVVPRASMLAHNADLGEGPLPANVEHVEQSVDREGWSRYMAQSRIVVVPLMPGVMQPAGISVYLEAMVLGKPVVISRGSSTEGILDDSLAVIVPAADIDAMRKAITDLWNDPVRRARVSARAREYALSLRDHARLVSDLRDVVDAAVAARRTH